MYNGHRLNPEKHCVSNSIEVEASAHRFLKEHWSYFRPGTEEKVVWNATPISPKGLWNRSAEMMMLHFGESGHPVFSSNKCVGTEDF